MLVARSGLDSQRAAAFDCDLIQVIKRLIDLSFCFLLHLLHTVKLKKGAIAHSEEVGLAHDAHELLFRDLTVSVAVSFLNHLCDLLICHILAKLLSHAF